MIVVACLGLVASLFIISSIHREREELILAGQSSRCKELIIHVRVEGAVACPGEYTFVPGITVKEILQKAKLLACADKKKINLKKKIFKDSSICIPEKLDS